MTSPLVVPAPRPIAVPPLASLCCSGDCAALFSTLGGFLFGLIWPAFVTMVRRCLLLRGCAPWGRVLRQGPHRLPFPLQSEEKRLLTSAWVQVMSMTLEHLNQYLEFNGHHWFVKLAGMRKEREESTPCTVPHVGYLLLGFFVSLLGLLCVGVAHAVLWVVKLLPLLCRAMVHLASNRRQYGCATRDFQEKWWTMPLFLLAFVAMPVVVCLAVAAGCVAGFFIGLYAGVVTYKKRSGAAGLRFIGCVFVCRVVGVGVGVGIDVGVGVGFVVFVDSGAHFSVTSAQVCCVEDGQRNQQVHL